VGLFGLREKEGRKRDGILVGCLMLNVGCLWNSLLKFLLTETLSLKEMLIGAKGVKRAAKA